MAINHYNVSINWRSTSIKNTKYFRYIDTSLQNKMYLIKCFNYSNIEGEHAILKQVNNNNNYYYYIMSCSAKLQYSNSLIGHCIYSGGTWYWEQWTKLSREQSGRVNGITIQRLYKKCFYLTWYNNIEDQC